MRRTLRVLLSSSSIEKGFRARNSLRPVLPQSQVVEGAVEVTGLEHHSSRHKHKPRTDGLIQINKLMAQRGLCSRHEADEYLKRGCILLNGQILEKGQLLINPATVETLELTDRAKQKETNKSTILLHKPLGIVSCQPERPEQTPAVQLLTADRQYMNKRSKENQNSRNTNPRNQRGWAVAGRLDVNSSGLLILTQSGKIASEIIRPNSKVEKEYLVRIPTVRSLDLKIATLLRGIEDEQEFLEAVSIEPLNQDQLKFVLTAGKPHHIRRMCQAVNLPVRAIKRVRIGNVVLGDLPLGNWKYLPHQKDLFPDSKET